MILLAGTRSLRLQAKATPGPLTVTGELPCLRVLILSFCVFEFSEASRVVQLHCYSAPDASLSLMGQAWAPGIP